MPYEASNKVLKFFLLIFLIIFFLAIGSFFHFDVDSFKTFLSQFPPWITWIIYIVLYVVVTFFIWLGPKDVFRIAAAVIYGALISTLLVYTAEMFNCLVLFTLSRKLGRSFVESKLKGKMRRVDEAIADTSFWSIFFLRFFPIIPFRFLDLGFGLTKISLRKYFVISLISSPLRIFFNLFFLSLGTEFILNPFKLQEYLWEHPYIMYLGFGYVVSSLFIIFILKRKWKKN